MSKEKVFLKDLQKKLQTQTNDGNASPYFWVIRQFEKHVTHEDMCDGYIYVHNDGDATEFESYEELDDWLYNTEREDLLEGIKQFDTLDSAFDWLEDVERDSIHPEFHRYPYESRAVLQSDTFFITKEEAQSHIRKNRRHYNSTAHTYAMTAWRSPQVEELFKILETCDWDKLNE